MYKWFKKALKDTTPVKPKTSISMLEYSSEANISQQYSRFNEGEEQVNSDLAPTHLQSTLNVPESNDAPSNSSCVEYRTTIDESGGRIIRRRPSRSLNSLINSARNTSLQSYVAFQYLGKEEYKGISAYWNGTEGDAGFPKNYVQLCVRVFNPNSHPPLYGHFIYRFSIGLEEDLKLLIDWLLTEEKTTFDNVKLEYVIYPGNIIKIIPGLSARFLQIPQNSVLRFCHKFILNPRLPINLQ